MQRRFQRASLAPSGFAVDEVAFVAECVQVGSRSRAALSPVRCFPRSRDQPGIHVSQLFRWRKELCRIGQVRVMGVFGFSFESGF